MSDDLASAEALRRPRARALPGAGDEALPPRSTARRLRRCSSSRTRSGRRTSSGTRRSRRSPSGSACCATTSAATAARRCRPARTRSSCSPASCSGCSTSSGSSASRSAASPSAARSAMWLGANAPERVDRLVLAGTSACFGPPERWIQRAALVRAEGLAEVADGAMERWFTADFGDSGALPRDARRRPRARATPRAATPRASGTSAPSCARICAPTLVDRRRRGPGDAARRRRGDRERDSRREARRRSSARPTCERRAARGIRRPRVARSSGGCMSDDEGMRVRREVLGDEHVDRAIESTTEFTADFQDLITRYAWGEIWARPGPRPEDAHVHHADRARRARPRPRARAARPRRAAERPDARRDQGGAAPVRRSTAASRRRTRRSRSRSASSTKA